MARKKNWNEKLNDSKDLPRTVVLSPAMQKKLHAVTMAIPAPLDVDAVMKDVPEGKVITINGIRNRIAQKYQADTGCPITSGIFAWIAAFASEDRRESGQGHLTPWWRTLKGGGMLNPKYPGGVLKQKDLLEKEGHIVLQAGKNWMVADLSRALVE